jgi:uncharacterized protein
MHSDMQHLLDLQAVDLRLQGLRRQVGEFPGREAEIQARLDAAKQSLAAAQDLRTASLKDRKKFELDVEQWRERARKYRDQSYEVKTNEAFKALQHELQHAEQQIAQAEDRLLQRMVDGEEYDGKVKGAELELKKAQAAAEGERRELSAQRDEVNAQLAAAEANRQKIAAEIPETLLEQYERVARRHHGIALAEVRNETCQACGVRVRPHVYQELRRSLNEQVFTCETCNRLIYVLEPARPAEGPGDAAFASQRSGDGTAATGTSEAGEGASPVNASAASTSSTLHEG